MNIRKGLLEGLVSLSMLTTGSGVLAKENTYNLEETVIVTPQAQISTNNSERTTKGFNYDKYSHLNGNSSSKTPSTNLRFPRLRDFLPEITLTSSRKTRNPPISVFPNLFAQQQEEFNLLQFPKEYTILPKWSDLKGFKFKWTWSDDAADFSGINLGLSGWSNHTLDPGGIPEFLQHLDIKFQEDNKIQSIGYNLPIAGGILGYEQLWLTDSFDNKATGYLTRVELPFEFSSKDGAVGLRIGSYVNIFLDRSGSFGDRRIEVKRDSIPFIRFFYRELGFDFMADEERDGYVYVLRAYWNPSRARKFSSQN